MKAMTCLAAQASTAGSLVTTTRYEAHRAFARMRLPEAEIVRRIAERTGLTLDLTDPD